MNGVNKFEVNELVLEKGNILLKRPDMKYLEDFYEYAKAEDIGPKAGWNPHKSIDESKRILEMFINNKNVFIIVDKEKDKMIGTMGIEAPRHEMDEAHKKLKGYEIGYALNKAYWGKSIVPTAVELVSDYLFTELDADYTILNISDKNINSRRVAEKMKFNVLNHHMGKNYRGEDEDYTIYILYNNKRKK